MTLLQYHDIRAAHSSCHTYSSLPSRTQTPIQYQLPGMLVLQIRQLLCTLQSSMFALLNCTACTVEPKNCCVFCSAWATPAVRGHRGQERIAFEVSAKTQESVSKVRRRGCLWHVAQGCKELNYLNVTCRVTGASHPAVVKACNIACFVLLVMKQLSTEKT